MLRYALSSRWLVWHVCCLVLISVLVAAGIWQWGVAMSDVNESGEPTINIRNLVYAVQWWIFAVFAVWFWLRYIRDQRDADIAELADAVRTAPDGQIEDSTNASSTTISLDASVEDRKARARAMRESAQPGADPAEISDGADRPGGAL